MAISYDWSTAQRQPAKAIFVVLYRVVIYLFRVLWPLLLVWLFKPEKSNSNVREMLIVVISVFLFLFSLLDYMYFRFSIPGNELIVKKGFFVKRNIVLPLDKIQAVHIEQNWLHQLLNLSQVSFDSPGSKNAEVKIAMHRDSAEALRSFIIGTKGSAETEEMQPAASSFLFTMGPSDLLKLGISANHLEAFFILLAFGFSLMDDIETVVGKQYEGALKWLSDWASTGTAAAIIAFALIVLFVSVAVSFIRIVLQYANFQISKTNRGFQIQSGMINTKEKLVPFNKVQYVSWKANWVRKQIPFYLLQFHSIGTMETKRKWEIKVPVTRKELIPVLLAEYHHQLPEDSPTIKIHPAYILRKTLVWGLLALILTTIAFPWFERESLWLLLPILYVFFVSWLFQRKFRLLLHPEALQVHRSVFGREELILQWHKIQSVQVRQSLYQRKRGLATVQLFTAGGTIQIPFIKLKQAWQIQNYALYKVESSTDNWI